MSAAAASSEIEKDKSTGHRALITGYNKDTNEIAFSDSWGGRFKERWITLDDAQRVSQNAFYTIGF
jgi:hypothetical protein